MENWLTLTLKIEAGEIADVSKSAAMLQTIQHGTIVVEPNGTQFKKDLTKLDLSGWRPAGRCGNCQHPLVAHLFSFYIFSFLFYKGPNRRRGAPIGRAKGGHETAIRSAICRCCCARLVALDEWRLYCTYCQEPSWDNFCDFVDQQMGSLSQFNASIVPQQRS